MKICSSCSKLKPLDDFHKHCRKRDGLQSLCKVCSTVSSVKSRGGGVEFRQAVQNVRVRHGEPAVTPRTADNEADRNAALTAKRRRVEEMIDEKADSE